MLNHTRTADVGKADGLMIGDPGGFRDLFELLVDENMKAMSAGKDALAIRDGRGRRGVLILRGARGNRKRKQAEQHAGRNNRQARRGLEKCGGRWEVHMMRWVV